jgi:glutamate/tyrosine decarboxylase-like PLP-dependent enzyme
MAGEEHRHLMNKVYEMFSQTNPLHTSVFPSVGVMEREVVHMTASLLGGLSQLHQLKIHAVDAILSAFFYAQNMWQTTVNFICPAKF